MFSSNTSQVASSSANYVEDVFSTYLYTGTGASQTITNNIDTTTYGGLVWIKGRSGATGHRFTDTARGTTKSLESNSTAAQATESTGLTAFGTTGFTIGADADYNTNAATYASWTFRKQAKFFDVVTYTGTGANRTIAHNLGSTPGCIIVKRTDTTGNWQVYHRGLTSAAYAIQVNLTTAQTSLPDVWNSTAPTSTVFSVGTNAGVNASGGTYVAYLFAHNAGGFGLTGSDNVISCGSYTVSANAATVNLGYEPQWVLTKSIDVAANWILLDTMRGFDVSLANWLYANTSGAEITGQGSRLLTNTGFSLNGATDGTYIYIAIRRGPMKTPTSGTSVFAPVLETPINGNTTVTAGFPVDLGIAQRRPTAGYNNVVNDRLRGGTTTYWASLFTQATNAEQTGGTITGLSFQNNTGIIDANYLFNDRGWNDSSIWWLFGRAPGFMDVVCYTGTGSATTFSHNLGVVPELIIVKSRSNAVNWAVYNSSLGATKYLQLNTDIAATTSSLWWNNTAPTSSVFTVGNGSNTGGGGYTYVAYLFATLAGVSKVGSYTGNGSTQTINCGFTNGARFVLIKRTDATGDWYVYDTARGMTTLTDPYLLLNSTAAESATLGSVTTVSSGFALNAGILAAINTNGASYIFLAIA